MITGLQFSNMASVKGKSKDLCKISHRSESIVSLLILQPLVKHSS
jgi:hypothetical protein